MVFTVFIKAENRLKFPIKSDTIVTGEAQMKEKPERKKEKIGKTKTLIGYKNQKTASIFYENRKLADAKKRKIRKPQ